MALEQSRHPLAPVPFVGLSDSLQGFSRRLDEVFEFLAQELPPLAEEISTVLGTIVPAGSEDTMTAASSLVAAKLGLEHEVVNAAAEMVGTQAQVKAGLAELRPCVLDLIKTLVHMRTSAQSLRFLALNASFVAQRGGDSRRGFVAATGELIDIAAQQLRDADRIMASINEARAFFEELENLGERFEVQVAAISAEGVAAPLGVVLGSLGQLQVKLAEIGARLTSVSAGLGHTMVAIQRQDVLKQGLAHVLLIDQELSRAVADSGVQRDVDCALESVEFQKQSGRLCADLLLNISGETDRLISEVETNLKDLVEAAATIRLVASDSSALLLGSQFSALQDAVATLNRDLAESNQLHLAHDRTLSLLEVAVRPLPAHVRMFSERQEQVRVLRFLVNRQDAHSSGTAGNQIISEALDSVCQVTGTGWDGFLDNVTGVRSQVRLLNTRAVLASRGGAPELAGRFLALEEIAGKVAREIEATRQRARSVAERVTEAAQRMLNALNVLRGGLGACPGMVDAYQNLSTTAAGYLEEALGGEAPSRDLPPLLAGLVEKFTILAHKQAAIGYDAASAAQVDEGDGLTLF